MLQMISEAKREIAWRSKAHPFKAVIALVLILLAVLWPSVDSIEVDFKDVRIIEGKASCRLQSSKYGIRNDYVIDGTRYFGRFDMNDGLTKGGCNTDADGVEVRVTYLVERTPPHRRLLVGIWRLRDGRYLEWRSPDQRIGEWQRELGVQGVDGLAMVGFLTLRLVLVALAITLFVVNPADKVGSNSGAGLRS